MLCFILVEHKTIVCLANSRKYGGYCVAGFDRESRSWIRPIGSGAHGAVTRHEQRLEDDSHPELLELIEIPLSHPAPEPGQPENWELAEGQWRSAGRLDEEDAREILEAMTTTEEIFGTSERSISAAEVEAGAVPSSLTVVRPEDLSWSKEIRYGKIKLRARFRHAGCWHDLGVTDVAWKAEFADEALGVYRHPDGEDVFLVISLAEPLDDQHYKLVAGVICFDAEV